MSTGSFSLSSEPPSSRAAMRVPARSSPGVPHLRAIGQQDVQPFPVGDAEVVLSGGRVCETIQQVFGGLFDLWPQGVHSTDGERARRQLSSPVS